MRQEGICIPSYEVWLKPLAAPDILEFNLPDKHICIVTDDGSHLGEDLVTQLQSRGWYVVVLRYYCASGHGAEISDTDSIGFDEANLVTLTGDDEETIRQQLEFIIAQYGPVGAFIHIHPSIVPLVESTVTFDAHSESVLRQVFLTAKYLQPVITTAVQPLVSGTRACFMTVTQADGGFGLLGERDIDVIAGGLSGLTKTLALEWPTVFCRAVDVSPDVHMHAATYILAELSDPNRQIREVGWNSLGRWTPEVRL